VIDSAFDPSEKPTKERFDVPKMVKKSDLPMKICLACGLPFAWRRKWAKNWGDVKFCSDRCRRSKAAKI
jgi:hypothetical protein